MLIEFDPAKDERNVAKRGLSFERAAEFDFETAAYIIDDRKNYGSTIARTMARPATSPSVSSILACTYSVTR